MIGIQSKKGGLAYCNSWDRKELELFIRQYDPILVKTSTMPKYTNMVARLRPAEIETKLPAMPVTTAGKCRKYIFPTVTNQIIMKNACLLLLIFQLFVVSSFAQKTLSSNNGVSLTYSVQTAAVCETHIYLAYRFVVSNNSGRTIEFNGSSTCMVSDDYSDNCNNCNRHVFWKPTVVYNLRYLRNGENVVKTAFICWRKNTRYPAPDWSFGGWEFVQ